MRIGLVTDIHTHAAELSRALALFREKQVDQVITLGDTIDLFGRAASAPAVVQMLRHAEAVGVWGNHDFGLCREISEPTRNKYGEDVLDFMSGMQGRILNGELHFSHRESSANPEDVEQLWNLSEGPRDLMEQARQSFSAVPERLQFVGHYHRWWAATSEGKLDWDGSTPLAFESGQRYWVIIAPIFNHCCAILDTTAGILTPHSLADADFGEVDAS